MHQAPVGQRINTDSCVFAHLITEYTTSSPHQVLDIGTGTGLLALMFAQHWPKAQITGLEPDQEVSLWAKLNFETSSFQDRLTILPVFLENFIQNTSVAYDLLVANPPYFLDSTPSQKRTRSDARHLSKSSLIQWVYGLHQLLSDHANLWLMVAEASWSHWTIEFAKFGIYPHHVFTLSDSPEHLPHLRVLQLKRDVPLECRNTSIHYRQHKNGQDTEWMARFRRQWFPEKFLKKLSKSD